MKRVLCILEVIDILNELANDNPWPVLRMGIVASLILAIDVKPLFGSVFREETDEESLDYLNRLE